MPAPGLFLCDRGKREVNVLTVIEGVMRRFTASGSCSLAVILL